MPDEWLSDVEIVQVFVRQEKLVREKGEFELQEIESACFNGPDAVAGDGLRRLLAVLRKQQGPLAPDQWVTKTSGRALSAVENAIVKVGEGRGLSSAMRMPPM